MPLLPGAEPYHHDGGPTAALLCHGLTGSPQSLRPWAERLAAAGLTVSLPRLPGHGTNWREMSRTRWEDWYAEIDRSFQELRGRCNCVFVLGLSLGGCLALRLAEKRPDDVDGLVLVNPSLVADDRRVSLLPALLPLLRPFPVSVRGLGDDIKRADAHEIAYDRLPLHALAGLPRLWARTRHGLGSLHQPILVFSSAEDHVVGPASVLALREGVRTSNLAIRECVNSYHVATLDNDATMIFEGSLEFIQDHSRPRLDA